MLNYIISNFDNFCKFSQNRKNWQLIHDLSFYHKTTFWIITNKNSDINKIPKIIRNKVSYFYEDMI